VLCGCAGRAFGHLGRLPDEEPGAPRAHRRAWTMRPVRNAST
jgi:hypothetical protein